MLMQKLDKLPPLQVTRREQPPVLVFPEREEKKKKLSHLTCFISGIWERQKTANTFIECIFCTRGALIMLLCVQKYLKVIFPQTALRLFSIPVFIHYRRFSTMSQSCSSAGFRSRYQLYLWIEFYFDPSYGKIYFILILIPMKKSLS